MATIKLTNGAGTRIIVANDDVFSIVYNDHGATLVFMIEDPCNGDLFSIELPIEKCRDAIKIAEERGG